MTPMINIYSLDKFELFSVERNKSFHFIKYDNIDYLSFCEYLRKSYPNLQLPEESDLQKGTIYTVNKNNIVNSIELAELRLVIASFPIIIVDNQYLPTCINRKQAIDYLKKDEANRVFCFSKTNPEIIGTTFQYKKKDKKFLKKNKHHKRGIAIEELPEYEHWFLGIEDGLTSIPYDYTIHYDEDTHVVSIEENLRCLSDQIAKLIYEINKSRNNTERTLVFEPSWEEYSIYYYLYRKCNTKENFEKFISSLYKLCYEFTKSKGGKSLELLPEQFKYHEFLAIVGEFRHYYEHEQSSYVGHRNIRIKDVFLKYLKRASEPHFQAEYKSVQRQLLLDTVNYLKELHNFCTLNITYRGIVEKDENGIFHCGEVRLPSMIHDMLIGAKCSCDVIPNKITSDKKYPYFCQYPSIECNGIPIQCDKIEKKTSVDGNSTYYTYFSIILPSSIVNISGIGQDLFLTRIRLGWDERTGDQLVYTATEIVVNLHTPKDLRVSFGGFVEDGVYVNKYHKDYIVKLISYAINKMGIKKATSYKTLQGIVSQRGTSYICGNVILDTNKAKYSLGNQIKIEAKNIEANKGEMPWITRKFSEL